MTHAPDARRSVLVVDDDDDFCLNITELLTPRGYDVRSARNGRQALEILTDESYAPMAMIVDLRMPEMDGFAFLAAWQVQPRLRQTAVIVVSAFGDPTGLEYDFLSKPINVSRLLRSLDKIAAGGGRPFPR